MITYPKRDLISKECADKLKKSLPLDKIYLFGSTARKDDEISSDIDICLIGPFAKSDKTYKKLVNNITAELYIENSIMINWIYFHRSEWENEKYPIILTIKKEGKILWEKEKIK